MATNSAPLERPDVASIGIVHAEEFTQLKIAGSTRARLVSL